MKKNFFKKLSFVLALAMIISAIAPAAGAFAAEAMHLSSTKKYLHLSAETGLNEYDFGIAHKVSGSTYVWSSDDEDVAVVDETNGLTTATGIGSATVSVDVTLKDGTVTTLSADVIVKDNIKTVTINNIPKVALAVGQEYNFNRDFVTVSGSTTKTTAITRWVVEGVNATINADNGIFKATAAGEFKVTALCFQSKAQYAEWLVSKATDLVKATSEAATVTVKAGIVSTKQTTLAKFEVAFDSDMSKTDLSKDTAKVYQVINGKQVATGTEKIKSLTLDTATGKIATVEMYTNFNEEALYNFVYGDLVGTFTSADVDLADVASIDFADLTANVNGTASALLDKVVGKDKNGVVIFVGDADSTDAAVQGFNSNVSFELASTADLTKTYLDGSTKVIYVYSKGYAAPVTATFTNYSYNDTTKVYDTVSLKDSAIVTGVETDGNLNSASIQYAVATAQPADDSTAWTSSSYKVAAKDTAYAIFTRYKNNDAASDTPYSVDGLGTTRFKYDSTNTDKLIVTGDYIYPISAGVVTVLVKDTANSDAVVGTFDVTIMAARAFASAVLDTAYVTAGNHGVYGKNGEVAKISVTDTMGDAAAATAGAVLSNGPTANPPVVNCVPLGGDDFGKLSVTVDARGHAAGAYSFKITVNHTATGTTKDVYITVVVIEANTADTDSTADVTSWRLELGSAAFDLKEVADLKTVDITVAGYNKNGVKIDELPVANYAVTITKDGTNINTATVTNYTDDEFYVVKGTSPSALTALGTGTYVVTAKAEGAANPTGKVAGAVIGSLIFSLNDTTTKRVEVSNPVVATSGGAIQVLPMIQNAFTLYLNGTAVSDANEANITGVKYYVAAAAAEQTSLTAPIAVGNSIYVTEVTYTVHNTNGTDTNYTFATSATIKAK